MTIRTSLASQVNTSIANIQKGAYGMQRLQEQVATGKKVNRPSDSPADTGKILNLRSERLRLDTYSSNIASGIQSMEFNASIMQSTVALIQRVQELTIQGSNDTLDQTGREIISNEIDAILESIFASSNSSIAGKFIFAGTEVTTAPFTATRNSDGEISNVTYNGNGEKIEYQIGPGTNIQVNQPGEEIYVDNNLLKTIINLRDDIRSGAKTYVSAGIDNLNSAYNSVLNSISKTGGVISTLQLTSNRMEDIKLLVAESLASAQSADLTELILHLKEQENVFTAALASSVMIFKTSILNYL